MRRLHTIWFVAVLVLVAATGSVAVARTTHRGNQHIVRDALRRAHRHTTTTLVQTTTSDPPSPTTPTTATAPTTVQPPETTPTTTSPPPTTPTTVATGCVGTPMLSGQADIDASQQGTTFCLAGTHKWTLTPKSGDKIIGDGTAVLDGGNSTQYAVISAANQTNVTLSNFEIRNYTINVDGQGAVRNEDRSATGWQLINLNSHDNGAFDGSNWNGAGADLGINWLVKGGRYHDNRQEGLAGGDKIGNTVVDGAEIDHNDFTDDSHTTEASSCGHEAGGFKWVGDNITVENSYIHDNACMGLWDDINSNGALITHNIINNNWNSGILHEVSLGATITYNSVSGNGFKTFDNKPPGCNPGWGGGISVSDSGHTASGDATIDISHNDVEGNCNGITGLDNGASGGSCGTECNVVHVHVHDNTVVGSTNALANNNSGNFEWDNDNDVANGDNTFANNTYSGGINFCGNVC
jgi:hypothetical protein